MTMTSAQSWENNLALLSGIAGKRAKCNPVRADDGTPEALGTLVVAALHQTESALN